MSEYNHMSKQELLEKTKNREITYDGDFNVNNSNDFSMPKAVIVSSKRSGKSVKEVIFGERSVYGYDGLEVSGKGLSVQSSKLLGFFNHTCKVRKNLIVSVDLDYVMEYMNEKDLSNKSRFLKKLEEYADEIDHSSLKIRIGKSVFSRNYISGYDIDAQKNILTFYMSHDFMAFQKTDKFIINTKYSKYDALNSDVEVLLCQILELNNFQVGGINTIRYDDLRYSIPIKSKRASNIKTSFVRYLDNLVDKGFLKTYTFAKNSMLEEVLKFQLGNACKVVHKIKQADTAFSAPAIGYNPIPQESVSKAIEATFESQGVNPEYLAHLEEQAAREPVEDASLLIKADSFDVWEEFDEAKFYGSNFNKGDNDICDDGIPF